MKSIYEAAVAYGREHQGTVNIEDFEAGANYVISCIEKEMLSYKEFSQNQLRLIMQFCEQLEATNK